MRRSLRWLSIGLLMLLVVVGAAVWFDGGLGPPADAMNEPPCGSTSRSKVNPETCSMLSSQQIPTVPYCALVLNPERYAETVVRTQAKFYSDAGVHSLSDSACGGEGKWASVDFSSSYGITAEAQNAFDSLLCARRRYHANKEADVVVVGRFETGNGKAAGPQFVVMCIEQAKNQRLTRGLLFK